MMARRNALIGLFFAFSVFGAGCFRTGETVTTIPRPLVSAPLGGSWTEVSAGFDRLEYRYSTSTSAKVIVYRIDEKQFEVRLSSGEAKTVAAWSDAEPTAILTANAAYFHEDDTPSGFVKVDGAQIGDRAFDLDKSGLILTHPQFRLVDTLAESVDLEGIEEGFQSFPFLLKDGESAIVSDSGLRARRTFIGTDRAGQIYLGLVEGDLSLFGLAQLLPDLGINWDMVLNLDGGPSSGLVTPLIPASRTGENSLSSVPTVLFVFPRK